MRGALSSCGGGVDFLRRGHASFHCIGLFKQPTARQCPRDAKGCRQCAAKIRHTRLPVQGREASAPAAARTNPCPRITAMRLFVAHSQAVMNGACPSHHHRHRHRHRQPARLHPGLGKYPPSSRAGSRFFARPAASSPHASLHGAPLLPFRPHECSPRGTRTFQAAAVAAATEGGKNESAFNKPD